MLFRSIPVVAIPTTAGTGSEASRYVAITDPVRDVKMLTTSDFLQPAAAIVDPGPTVTMPASVTASTGIDALTHAIESYVAKTSHPMSDAMGSVSYRWNLAQSRPRFQAPG